MNGTVDRTGQRTILELLTAARDGDRLALGEYLSRTIPELRDKLVPHLMLKGRSDWTEDIIQEVILKVLAIISQSGDAKSASLDLQPPWLFCVAKRTAVDWHRRERKTSVLKKVEAERLVDPGDRRWEERLARDQATALLALLPDRFKPLFRLLYIDGLSMKQAAAALGLSPQAAYQREWRGLELVRRILRDNPRLDRRVNG